jgi:signal peptidase II
VKITLRGARPLFLLLAAALVSVDQGSKWIVRQHLPGRDIELIPGFLDLVFAENRDVAFSLLRWVPEGARLPMLITIGIVAVFALAYASIRADVRLVERLCWTSVLAGACGNVTDRLTRGGAVTDFILAHWHEHPWPVFNFADMCISVGVVALLVFGKGKPKAAPPEKPS